MNNDNLALDIAVL